MSTTIEIIPISTTEITYGQIIYIGERNINTFLTSIGIQEKIRLSVKVHDNEEKYVKQVNPDDIFKLKNNEYAWFHIPGVAGGTDAYQQAIKDEEIDPDNPWWRFDEMEENNTIIAGIKDKFEIAKNLNVCWYFRRSMGQRGLISLSYGLISAGIAELTQGILWSDDGAWDFKRFPAESNEFLKWYFRPENALKEDNADWAQRCIDGIPDDMKDYNNTMKKDSWLSLLWRHLK